MDSIQSAPAVKLPLEIREKELTSACNMAVKNIAMQVLQALIDGQALSPSAFVDKHITQVGQEELSNLDANTHVFMKNILFEVIQHYSSTPQILTGFAMLSLQMGDDQLTSKLFKEKALPEIKSAIIKLNELDPSIVQEATSTGVDPQEQAILNFFKIN